MRPCWDLRQVLFSGRPGTHHSTRGNLPTFKWGETLLNLGREPLKIWASSIQGKQTKHLGRDSSAARAWPEGWCWETNGVATETTGPRLPHHSPLLPGSKQLVTRADVRLAGVMELNLRSEKRRFWEITCFRSCHKKYTNCQLQGGQQLPTASEQEAKGKSSRAIRQALRGLELRGLAAPKGGKHHHPFLDEEAETQRSQTGHCHTARRWQAWGWNWGLCQPKARGRGGAVAWCPLVAAATSSDAFWSWGRFESFQSVQNKVGFGR